MHKPPLPTLTRTRTHQLRADSTDAERKLWECLRGGRLGGFKFRRQHPITPYIADFYCESGKLVIELDGSQHGAEVDSERTRYLESQGLAVMRFWGNDVLMQTEVVVEAIFNHLDGRTLTPTPLPEGEGPKSTAR